MKIIYYSPLKKRIDDILLKEGNTIRRIVLTDTEYFTFLTEFEKDCKDLFLVAKEYKTAIYKGVEIRGGDN